MLYYPVIYTSVLLYYTRPYITKAFKYLTTSYKLSRFNLDKVKLGEQILILGTDVVPREISEKFKIINISTTSNPKKSDDLVNIIFSEKLINLNDYIEYILIDCRKKNAHFMRYIHEKIFNFVSYKDFCNIYLNNSTIWLDSNEYKKFYTI